MAGIPKVKITFDADLEELKRGVKGATDEVEGFGSRVADFGKKAAAAFAVAATAAAAYAAKLAIDGVKAAIEDEQAQKQLAGTLQRVTKATDKQIAAVEDYITKTSLAKGVTDDKLRPALARLVLSLGSVEKSQKLLNLALDISAATGKSVQSVSEALAKAYDGNSIALKKLGVDVAFETTVVKDNTAQKQAAERAQLAYNLAIDKYGVSSPQAAKAGLVYQQALENVNNVTTTTQKSTVDFNGIVAQLTDKFGGAASANAETFAGKMARLQVAFDEAKETVGSFILTAITPLVENFVNKVIPVLGSASTEIGGKLQPVISALGNYIRDVLIPNFVSIYNFIKDYVVPVFTAIFVPALSALFSAFEKISQALKDNEADLKPLRDAFFAFATFIRDTIAPIIGSFLSVTLGAIANVISSLINIAGNLTAAISGAFEDIKDFFTNVRDYFATRATSFFAPFVDAWRSVLNSIISLWNRVDFTIDITIPSWVPVFGGDRFYIRDIIPDIPYLAEGGIVTRPTLAMIGEAGAEAVVPLTGSNRPDMGNTYNITVNGALDAEGTARTIVRLLNSSLDRGTGGAGAFRSATA